MKKIYLLDKYEFLQQLKSYKKKIQIKIMKIQFLDNNNNIGFEE